MVSSIFLGMVGPWQIVLIVALVLLLFGGRKIPELMKGLGGGVKEFKKAMKDTTEELKGSVNDTEEKKKEE